MRGVSQDLTGRWGNPPRLRVAGGPLGVQRFLHQDAASLGMRRALQEMGLPEVDVNGASQLGPGGAASHFVYQTTTRRGRRASSNRYEG